jgi:hypothetical protein
MAPDRGRRTELVTTRPLLSVYPRQDLDPRGHHRPRSSTFHIRSKVLGTSTHKCPPRPKPNLPWQMTLRPLYMMKVGASAFGSMLRTKYSSPARPTI